MTDQDKPEIYLDTELTTPRSLEGAVAAPKLDQLFAEARLQQTELVDDNFTKMVMNRLPTKPLRINKKAFLPDAIGLLVGLLVAWRFFEPQIAASKWLSLFPSNIAISSSNMLLVSAALSIAAFVAWWSVERKSLF